MTDTFTNSANVVETPNAGLTEALIETTDKHSKTKDIAVADNSLYSPIVMRLGDGNDIYVVENFTNGITYIRDEMVKAGVGEMPVAPQDEEIYNRDEVNPDKDTLIIKGVSPENLRFFFNITKDYNESVEGYQYRTSEDLCIVYDD